MTFNLYGTWAIYRFEMARALRTVWQSLVTVGSPGTELEFAL